MSNMEIFRQLDFRGRLAYTRKFKHLPSIVRVVLKVSLTAVALVLVIISLCLSWLYFYSGDLPNSSLLAKFAPLSPATVSDECSSSPVQAVPSTLIGTNLRNAARAAKGQNAEIFALQIARSSFCNSQLRMLK